MSVVSKGDTVRIHYTGRLSDGTIFDSSEDRDPLEFEVGAGEVIPGFDTAVEGMTAGDAKTVTIPSVEAYGPRRDELVLSVSPQQMPADVEPKVGQPLMMQTAEGQSFQVVISAVGEAEIELDANHPLAGQDLTFDILMVGTA